MRKQYVRLLVAIIVLPILSLTGCFSEKPDEKLLKLTLERELSRAWEQPVKLQKLDTDWIMATESRGETQASFSFAFSDGVYEPMSGEDFFSTAIPADQMEKIEKRRESLQEYGISGMDFLTPRLIQKFEKTVFLKELASPKTTFAGTYEVSAIKGTQGWTFNFRQPNFSVPSEILAGRKAQQGEIIMHSPESKTFVAQMLKEIDTALTQGEKKAEEVKKQRQSRYEADKKVLLTLMEAKQHLMLLYEVDGLREPQAFIQIESAEAGSGIVAGTITMAETPEETKSLTASMVLAPERTVSFGFSDGQDRLQFTVVNDTLVMPKNKKERLIIVAQSKEAQTKELERARVKAKAAREEREAKEQEKQATLKKIETALSAGSGFEGSWKVNDEAGLLGLAIETVNSDGSGFTGYLFDPTDRDKRKPFSGVIKQDYPTFSVTITTERGKGLKSYYNAPVTQRMWLEASLSTNVIFNADAKYLTGTFARESGSIKLAVIENFKDIVAKDLAEEETRKQAIRAAAQQGGAWLGKYAYNNSVGEFGLYFTSFKDDVVSAEVFALSNPKATKKFSGLLNLAKGAEAAIVLNGERNSGLEYKNYHNSFERDWLRKDSNYTFNLSLNEGKLTGKTTSGYSVSLVPMKDYDERVAQWTKQETRKELLFTAAIQVGNSYLGAWQDDSESGEISLKIIETSPTGINFKAQLCDPAHPENIWDYMGSVVYDKKDQRMVTLTPMARKEWKDYPRKSTRARLYNHNGSHDIFSLYIDGNALSGDWRNAKVKLVKTGTPLADMVKAKLPKDVKPQPDQNTPAKRVKGANEAPVQGASQAEQASPLAKEPAKEPAKTPAFEQKPPTASAVTLPKLTPLPTEAKKALLHATLVKVEGEAVTIALQVRAVGKSIKGVRIDNIGGLSSLWQTDNPKALPLTVTTEEGKPYSSVTAPATGEQIFIIQLHDNGAFSTQKTQLRFTAFFNDGSRAMGLLKP